MMIMLVSASAWYCMGSTGSQCLRVTAMFLQCKRQLKTEDCVDVPHWCIYNIRSNLQEFFPFYQVLALQSFGLLVHFKRRHSHSSTPHMVLANYPQVTYIWRSPSLQTVMVVRQYCNNITLGKSSIVLTNGRRPDTYVKAPHAHSACGHMTLDSPSCEQSLEGPIGRSRWARCHENKEVVVSYTVSIQFEVHCIQDVAGVNCEEIQISATSDHS